MSTVSDTLQKLRALGATLRRDGERLILRPGKVPIPEPVIEMVRALKLPILEELDNRPSMSRLDEHLRQQTASKPAENLGSYEDAHHEHLRMSTFDEIGDKKGSKPAENLGSYEGAHPHGRMSTLSTFAEPQQNCGSQDIFGQSPGEDAHAKVLMVSTFAEPQQNCGFEASEHDEKRRRRSSHEVIEGDPPLAAPTGSIKCCECGLPITERLETWWGPERCHRACGEAAFQRAKARRAYLPRQSLQAAR